MSALDKQVGGDHYKGRAIQPVEYIHANDLDFFQGNVVKYITRWRDKKGIEDLEKCKHYLELYIELESKQVERAAAASETSGGVYELKPLEVALMENGYSITIVDGQRVWREPQ